MTDSLTNLQLYTYFTFIIALFGMFAGTLYFFMQRSELQGPFRQAAIISCVITFVAGMTYYFMKDIYLDGAASGGGYAFPTEFRYIDWFITVPLMLIKFPALLGMGGEGRKFLTKLIILSLGMLLFAYIGEVNFETKAIHFGSYGISCLCWLVILFSLNGALRSLPLNTTESKRAAIRRMFLFILIGWVIYPIGYLMPTFGLQPDYRELLYNIGDVINKVGLGLVIIAGGFAHAKETNTQAS